MIENPNEYKGFKKIVNLFYNEAIEDLENENENKIEPEKTIKIEPKIIFDNKDGNLKMEILVCQKKMSQ